MRYYLSYFGILGSDSMKMVAETWHGGVYSLTWWSKTGWYICGSICRCKLQVYGRFGWSCEIRVAVCLRGVILLCYGSWKSCTREWIEIIMYSTRRKPKPYKIAGEKKLIRWWKQVLSVSNLKAIPSCWIVGDMVRERRFYKKLKFVLKSSFYRCNLGMVQNMVLDSVASALCFRGRPVRVIWGITCDRCSTVS